MQDWASKGEFLTGDAAPTLHLADLLAVHSYVLFSIGNVTPLFQASFKSCWKTHKICNHNWIAAVNYLETAGILIGQLLVGVLGDWYVIALTTLIVPYINHLNTGLADAGVSFKMPLLCSLV